MGQRAGCFYRIDREKQKNFDWVGPRSQTCLEWEGTGKYRVRSWLGISGLAAWIYWGFGPGAYLQGHESYVTFGLLTWYPGRNRPLWSLESFFNRTKTSAFNSQSSPSKCCKPYFSYKISKNPAEYKTYLSMIYLLSCSLPFCSHSQLLLFSLCPWHSTSCFFVFLLYLSN